jgi:hypothetical protein
MWADVSAAVRRMRRNYDSHGHRAQHIWEHEYGSEGIRRAVRSAMEASCQRQPCPSLTAALERLFAEHADADPLLSSKTMTLAQIERVRSALSKGGDVSVAAELVNVFSGGAPGGVRRVEVEGPPKRIFFTEDRIIKFDTPDVILMQTFSNWRGEAFSMLGERVGSPIPLGWSTRTLMFGKVSSGTAVQVLPRLDTRWQERRFGRETADTLIRQIFNAHVYGKMWFADKHPGQIALSRAGDGVQALIVFDWDAHARSFNSMSHFPMTPPDRAPGDEYVRFFRQLSSVNVRNLDALTANWGHVPAPGQMRAEEWAGITWANASEFVLAQDLLYAHHLVSPNVVDLDVGI